MKKFMEYDFDVKKIAFVYHMDGGEGETLHKNRKNHGLAFFADGKNLYEFSDGEKIVVKSGEIIYLPKGSTYKVSTLVPGKCRAVNFELASEVSFSPFSKALKNSSAVMECFQRMKNVWEYKKSGYMARCKSELFFLIYTMQKEFHLDYLPKSKAGLIEAAVDYIHKNYCTTALSVTNLSKMCSISPEYFRKIFKSLYGVSPITYINSLKITRARELLESGIYTASESALMSGYNDLSVFSREFKKTTGVCPSEYAKKNNQLQ